MGVKKNLRFKEKKRDRRDEKWMATDRTESRNKIK
jgi:hypothetical protein